MTTVDLCYFYAVSQCTYSLVAPIEVRTEGSGISEALQLFRNEQAHFKNERRRERQRARQMAFGGGRGGRRQAEA